MKKKIQIVLGLLCIGVLGSSACGGAKSKEYQAAVEIYNRELSRDRVPWITLEGIETDISTRAFKFALMDINPGKLPDLILLKDSGKNQEDDGMCILDTCYKEDGFQVQELQDFKGYYPNTGIYVVMEYFTSEDGHTYYWDPVNGNVNGKIENYYYLPDCSKKDTDSIPLNGMKNPIGSYLIKEDNGENVYEWYGFNDGENTEEYFEHIHGDCTVSKEEFEKNLKEYVKSTKLLEVSKEDFHDNTEENRNKYFK